MRPTSGYYAIALNVRELLLFLPHAFLIVPSFLCCFFALCSALLSLCFWVLHILLPSRLERKGLRRDWVMKLRLRSLESEDTLQLDVPDLCSLPLLRQILADRLSHPPGSSFRLSLNRTDELQSSNPADSLQSLGLESGDLVFYSLDPGGFASPEDRGSSNPDFYAGAFDQVSQGREGMDSENWPDLGGRPEEAADSEMTTDLVPEDGREVDASGRADGRGNSSSASVDFDGDGLLAADGSVAGGNKSGEPYFLFKGALTQRVSEEELGRYGGKLIVIAVHAVMQESGFVALDPVTEMPADRLCGNPVSFRYSLPELVARSQSLNMPECVTLTYESLGNTVIPSSSSGKEVHEPWASYLHTALVCRASAHCGNFPTALSASASAAASASALRRIITVYGSLAKANSDLRTVLAGSPRVCCLDMRRCLWVEGDDNDMEAHEDVGFSTPYPVKKMFEFWQMVKDRLASPLLRDLTESTGLSLPSYFMCLPPELKLKIFESLSGVDLARVGCVCSELRYSTANNDLWKQKYMDVVSNSWKRKYMAASKRKTEYMDVSERKTEVTERRGTIYWKRKFKRLWKRKVKRRGDSSWDDGRTRRWIFRKFER